MTLPAYFLAIHPGRTFFVVSLHHLHGRPVRGPYNMTGWLAS